MLISLSHLYLVLVFLKQIDTVVASMTFSSVKPTISPSNVALNANQGTVLKSALPEDFKTSPTW